MIGKTRIVAKLHTTGLVIIYSHSREGKTLFYSQINIVVLENWTCKCQFQRVGFEMSGNDASWYAYLGEKGHFLDILAAPYGLAVLYHPVLKDCSQLWIV